MPASDIIAFDLVTTFTFDRENLFSNAHSHDEYLWQSLTKSPPLSTDYTGTASCEIEIDEIDR